MEPERILYILVYYLVLLFSLSVHESAHAWAALQQGDDTALREGRISLNPLVHIDPFGTVLFPLVGMILGGWIFGWAKPTPMQPRNFRDLRWGQISTSGGSDPRWSRNGDELFYRSGTRVMRVPIETEPAFEPGASEVLIDGPYRGRDHYDVAPDGQRFLMVKVDQGDGSEAGARAVLVFVQNWFQELTERVPVP